MPQLKKPVDRLPRWTVLLCAVVVVGCTSSHRAPTVDEPPVTVACSTGVDQAKSAGIGAGIGAGLGAGFAGLGRKNALLGAVIGAVPGAAAGYMISKTEECPSEEEAAQAAEAARPRPLVKKAGAQ